MSEEILISVAIIGCSTIFLALGWFLAIEAGLCH